MMEILARSIARAGGIEVPPDVRILPRPPRKPARRLLVRLAGRLLRIAGAGLGQLGGLVARAGERLAAPPLAPIGRGDACRS